MILVPSRRVGFTQRPRLKKRRPLIRPWDGFGRRTFEDAGTPYHGQHVRCRQCNTKPSGSDDPECDSGSYARSICMHISCGRLTGSSNLDVPSPSSRFKLFARPIFHFRVSCPSNSWQAHPAQMAYVSFCATSQASESDVNEAMQARTKFSRTLEPALPSTWA